MAQLARSELNDAKDILIVVEENIVRALTPRDDADERGIVLEVRAGTGNVLHSLSFLKFQCIPSIKQAVTDYFTLNDHCLSVFLRFFVPLIVKVETKHLYLQVTYIKCIKNILR